jgi:N-acetylglucosamine kinase-like BadF-type ATPase
MCQNESAMPFFLGIDGGGSKSTAALSDGATVLATHTAGGCNLNTVSRDAAHHALAEAVDGALRAAGVSANSVAGVCAGVAGATSPEVAATISEILSAILPLAMIHVVPDTIIALEADFAGGPGIVCISGTGSIAYGRTERGEIARAGGWGRPVSDEGSGNWIGQCAVSHCLRALDMGRSSSLITGIMHYWKIATREQLVQRCRDQGFNFAELFPVVLAAAEASDPLACELLTSAGIELARIAQVVLRRLWVGRTSLEIVMTGGVFSNSAHIRRVFSNLIRADRPEVRVRLSKRQPFDGALYLAQRNLSEPRAVS